ncbi:MAG: acetoacetate--CoA ligase family protein [Deltaproteobacteria bacterium]|nr:MAG: acetoacetate--CoA ligase family protein [Deltaproteobacteria bacterium]
MMSTLEEILRTEAELEDLARELAHEQDVERIQDIARRIQEGANQILEMGRSLDRSLAAARRCGTRSRFTRAEREQVARATGVALEALFLENVERWVARMPRVSAAIIERLAMTSIAESARKEARRKQALAIVKELEAIPDPLPETKAAIEEFKREYFVP